MDWEFIEEELRELLDGNGLHAGTVDRFDSIVSRFVARLADNHQEEGEFDEDGTDSEWGSL